MKKTTTTSSLFTIAKIKPMLTLLVLVQIILSTLILLQILRLILVVFNCRSNKRNLDSIILEPN